MSFLRKLYYHFPIRWRRLLRKIYYLPSDFLNLRKRPFHVPSDGDNFIGPGNFEEIGNEFFNLSRSLVELSPNSYILEIGCGMGRMAYPYKSFLSGEGKYWGIDIVPEGIAWCKDRIAPDDERFEFILADIKNALYNPQGKFKANEYTFPFENEYFDYIFLTSVFTHMLPDGIKQYLKEIERMLKSNGKVLATFFIINQNVTELIKQKKSMFNFDIDFGNYRTISREVQESNIALEEHFLKSIIVDAGLIIESIEYGSWSGISNGLTFQDVVILTKND